MFQSGRIRIGVGDQCDLRIPKLYEGLPAEAAEVTLLDDGEFYISPTQGRVPVLINGRVITRITPLRSEDYIRIGQSGPEVIFRHGHRDVNLGMKLVPEYPLVRLEFLDGSLAGKALDVKLNRPVTIGRLPSADIHLDPRTDITVSGRHCTLRWDDVGTQFVLRDCSRNGTYVDEAPVDEEALVTDGCEIRLSATGPRFVFHVRGPQRDYPNSTPSAPDVPWEGDFEDVEEFAQEEPLHREGALVMPEVSSLGTAGGGDWGNDRIPTDEPRRVEPDSPPPDTGEPVLLPESQRPADSVFSPPEMDDDLNTDFGEAEPQPQEPHTSHDPPTDPVEIKGVLKEIGQPGDPASQDTQSQALRTSSAPSYLSDPELRRAASRSGGTWPRQGTIGPTLEPPVSPQRRSSRPFSSVVQHVHSGGRLGDLPTVPGKWPAVPIRLNLIRRDSGSSTPPSSPFGEAGPSAIGWGPFLSRPWTSAIAVLVLVGLVYALVPRSQNPDPMDPVTHLPEPGRSLILSMKNPRTIRNPDGAFSVKVPSGWDHSIVDGVLQISSPAGEFAMDVIRMDGLSSQSARKALGHDGVPVTYADEVVADGYRVQSFAAQSGTVHRVGALLRRKGKDTEAPIFVMLEADGQHLNTIPLESLSQLMVAGIEFLEGAPARPVAMATPTPEPRPSPAPSTQVAVVETPVPSSGPATPDSAAVMALPDVGIRVQVPEGWTGTEDQGRGVLALVSPDGLDIRIAAGSERVVSEDIRRALVEEGWREVGTVEANGMRIAQFRLGREHIGVSVVTRLSSPPGVIYAQWNQPLTEAHLALLGRLAKQVSVLP